MLAFYERWTVPSAEATPTASPVIALAQAQRWLRDSSNGQVRAYLEGLLDDSGNWVPQAMLEHVWENVVLQDPQAFPYSKPGNLGRIRLLRSVIRQGGTPSGLSAEQLVLRV